MRRRTFRDQRGYTNDQPGIGVPQRNSGICGQNLLCVNKIDLVTDGERSEVLEFVAKTIRSQIGCDNVKVYPVSARLGLIARTSGNAALYEQSGLKALEDALVSFLSGEKSAAFLAAVAHKALRILDDEAAQGAFGETFGTVALQAHARIIQQKKSTMIQHDPYSAVAAVMAARVKLETLSEGILNGRMAETAETEAALSPITVGTGLSNEGITAPIHSYSPEGTMTDLVADLRTRGCPVCRHIEKYVMDFFAQWQYQLATEERAQAEFALELGFCPLHAWQLLAVSSPLGASIGLARLAEQMARHLKTNTGTPIRGEMVRRLVRDSRNCRVCKLLSQAEMEYIRRLATLIDEAVGRSQYHHSQGVCLRHLGMLLDTVPIIENREFLLAHAAQCFEEDTEDMRNYALKREALRRALQNRNEEDAYRRAMIHIVGDRNVCIPWAEDREI